jgi:hypothetical protein
MLHSSSGKRVALIQSVIAWYSSDSLSGFDASVGIDSIMSLIVFTALLSVISTPQSAVECSLK